MKTIHYQLILDKSGSMSDVREATIESVNEQVQQIRQLAVEFPEQPIKVSLYLFNHRVKEILSNLSPAEVPLLSTASYEPEGSTALLDAIGSTVNKLQQILTHELQTGEAEVIVVIVTDGHENASSHFTLAQISDLIKELEQTGNWKFNYLGATLDAIDVATHINIDVNFARSFDKANTKQAFNSVSDSMRSVMYDRRSNKDAKWKLKDDNTEAK